MTDIREDILARLVEVIAAVNGINTAHRNETFITPDQLPAGNVLDGDEENITDKTQPIVMEMTPEIRITQHAEGIGSSLTAFRADLIKLVLNDATLNTLTGSNGRIRYLGCSTEFGWQEKWFGSLLMRFSFKYPLQLNKL